MYGAGGGLRSIVWEHFRSRSMAPADPTIRHRYGVLTNADCDPLHGGRNHAAHADRLHERAHLVDIRTRQTLKQSRRIAIADGTDKVRFDLATREEFPINSLIVEPGHRSAVEPDGPRRYDKVGALQAAVAEGCCFGKTGLVDKPGSGVNVRKQARQPVVEPGVVTDDRRHRRVCHLLPVTLKDEGL